VVLSPNLRRTFAVFGNNLWRTSAVAFPGYVGRLVETFAGACFDGLCPARARPAAADVRV
jgi:hypothetical protein